jgi:hypothetical protein
MGSMGFGLHQSRDGKDARHTGGDRRRNGAAGSHGGSHGGGRKQDFVNDVDDAVGGQDIGGNDHGAVHRDTTHGILDDREHASLQGGDHGFSHGNGGGRNDGGDHVVLKNTDQGVLAFGGLQKGDRGVVEGGKGFVRGSKDLKKKKVKNSAV